MSTGRTPTLVPPGGAPSPFAPFMGQSYYPRSLIAPQGQSDDLNRVAAAVKTAKPGGAAQVVIVPSMRLGWTFVPAANAVLIGLLAPAIQAVRAPAGWSSPGMVSAKACLAAGGSSACWGRTTTTWTSVRLSG